MSVVPRSWQTVSEKGQTVNIFGFVGHRVNYLSLLLSCKAAVRNMYRNGGAYALVKLYLQEQTEGHIWSTDSSLQIAGVHCLLESMWTPLPERT